MLNKQHTPDQVMQAAQLDDAIRLAPLDKQYIVKLIVDTFINGMTAQRELTSFTGIPTQSADQPTRTSA